MVTFFIKKNISGNQPCLRFSLLFVTSAEYSTSLILNDICAEQLLRRSRREMHWHSHWDINYKKGTTILPKGAESQIRTHWRRLFHSLGKKEECQGIPKAPSSVKKRCSCHSTNKVSWNTKRRQTLKRSILFMKSISCQKDSFPNAVGFHVIYTEKKLVSVI